jgi:ABC-2 type transport system permease protein
MKKSFTIFFLFTKYSFKGILQQPFSLVVFFIGKFLRFGMYFFFLYYLVSNTKLLAGYTLNQTIIFFLTFNLIDTTTQLLFREVYRFKPFLVAGELDTVLVKPYHPFLRILTGGIDLMDAVLLIPYCVLLSYFIHKTSPAIGNIGMFIFFIVNSLIIGAAFHITILAIGVLIIEVDNAISIYRDFGRLTMVPVDIYREPLRFIITFIIPIGLMMSIPVKVLFGMTSLPVILISFIISLSSLFCALLLWNSALKKYQSWGG